MLEEQSYVNATINSISPEINGDSVTEYVGPSSGCSCSRRLCCAHPAPKVCTETKTLEEVKRCFKSESECWKSNHMDMQQEIQTVFIKLLDIR